MTELTTGILVESQAGHDKGRHYLVIGMDEKYVYLTDGRLRPSASPKRKNRRHIVPVETCDKNFGECDPKMLRDETIRRWIRTQKIQNR